MMQRAAIFYLAASCGLAVSAAEGAPFLSPEAIQQAIGRGAKKLLGEPEAARKTTRKSRTRARRPVVAPGSVVPQPPVRPDEEVADPEAGAQALPERLGSEPIEPRAARPLAKPQLGGPVPAEKLGSKQAESTAGERDEARDAAEVAPAGTGAISTPEAPVSAAEEPSARDCRIGGADFSPVGQPEPGDLACRVPVPVSVTSVGGGAEPVLLGPAATLDCDMAETVADWVRDAVAPAARAILDTRVTGLTVAASFDCRRRNNLADGKLSEHATGNALDVSAFTFSDGSRISVEEGWKEGGAEKAFLATVRSGACGHFTTVLGPTADAYHEDHIHLDKGCHGVNCAYLICQ